MNSHKVRNSIPVLLYMVYDGLFSSVLAGAAVKRVLVVCARFSCLLFFPGLFISDIEFVMVILPMRDV